MVVGVLTSLPMQGALAYAFDLVVKNVNNLVLKI
jgi:hypothetical protein